MKYISFGAAANIFECLTTFTTEKIEVSHKHFRKFCLLLGKFERRIREEIDEDEYFWNFFLLRLKRYRFKLCAAPLPFDHTFVYSPDNLQKLKRDVDNSSVVFPTYYEDARELLGCFEVLVGLKENPILDEMISRGLFKNGKEILLIKEPRMISPIEDIFSKYPNLRRVSIITAHQLKGSAFNSDLLCIGPSQWFPEYVFFAPRAKKMSLIHYDWIKCKLNKTPVFLNEHVVDDKAGKEEGHARPIELQDYQSPEDLLPTINWSRISREFGGESTTISKHEEVKAKLFVLEGGQGVFLDAEEGSSSIIIDLEQEDESRVIRAPISDIKQGIFLLLRTEGGGDFIISVADRILGESASKLRKMQKMWKNHLREKAIKNGLLNVIVELRLRGSHRANETNLRNWMSYRSIKTQDYDDFAAIMNVIGLGDSAKKYWDAMELVDSAHRKAGSVIRKMLLKLVLTSDLNELERSGMTNFRLMEVDGGSMTAIRVVGISPDYIHVQASNISSLFTLKDDLWQG